MSNVNKMIILGRLTKDPELKSLTNGSKVCEFTVVTNERYNDKNGNKQEVAEFHNLIAWNKQAEVIAEHKRKGDEIFIMAKKKTAKWQDKDTGDNRSKVEFHVTEFEFVGTRNTQSQQDDSLPFEQ